MAFADLLTSGIRNHVKSKLKDCGFSFDGRRTFRRLDKEGALADLLDFQAGVRSLEGKFTVNVGIYAPQFYLGPDAAPPFERAKPYHCLHKYYRRLGELRDTPLSRALSVLCGPRSLIAVAFTGNDKWWRISADEITMQKELEDVLKDFSRYGEKWFSLNHDMQALQAAWQEARERIERA